MIFYLLLCNIFFLPLIHTNSTTVSKPEIPNKSLPESRMVNNFHNETKVTLSEGGSLLPDTSILALPKEKQTIVSLVDTELVKSKVKPVVARKGVVYEENIDKTQHKVSPTSNEISTMAPKIVSKANVPIEISNTKTNVITSKANSTLLNKISSGIKAMNKTETHKKPSVLSYDALANMKVVSSSSETVVQNQIQSPTKGIKIYAKNANSHPGMIMPLVITILLVPMFAVLGYMALRRGQEAWKNRHYKRMDFLLDGMYND